MVFFATPHLNMRECTLDDLLSLYERDSDPEVVRSVSYGPWTLEECHHDLIFHINEQGRLLTPEQMEERDVARFSTLFHPGT